MSRGGDGYDAVVVGGRCAGSVLALRLAPAGARVAVVDRDPIGGDTLSTHATTTSSPTNSACCRSRLARDPR